mmetsp:Transcript_94217/g.270128  ORF Transcript_94217/g.270128 Transcript_94217/m.270128 type:complete len:330 (-) Transcript_94217:1346-2335(-)
MPRPTAAFDFARSLEMVSGPSVNLRAASMFWRGTWPSSIRPGNPFKVSNNPLELLSKLWHAFQESSLIWPSAVNAMPPSRPASRYSRQRQTAMTPHGGLPNDLSSPRSALLSVSNVACFALRPSGVAAGVNAAVPSLGATRSKYTTMLMTHVQSTAAAFDDFPMASELRSQPMLIMRLRAPSMFWRGTWPASTWSLNPFSMSKNPGLAIKLWQAFQESLRTLSFAVSAIVASKPARRCSKHLQTLSTLGGAVSIDWSSTMSALHRPSRPVATARSCSDLGFVRNSAHMARAAAWLKLWYLYAARMKAHNDAHANDTFLMCSGVKSSRAT